MLGMRSRVARGLFGLRGRVLQSSLRWGSTTTTTTTSGVEAKPFVASTPIFYVNALPHIGHLHTIVLTDTIVRFQRLLGRRALLCTGTDEHGLKVQKAAQKAGMDAKEFCDGKSERFKQLAPMANVHPDLFVRTTDPDHAVAVQHFWRRLYASGHIYKGLHEGWYSVDDETFYSANAVEERQLEDGSTKMFATETGALVEWSVEENYQFRLTAFRDQLLQYYEQHPEFVQPTNYRDQLVEYIQTNLRDLSISRPKSRLSWGISVPDADDHVIYVWFDALINYLTKCGYPWSEGGQAEMTRQGWPMDVHVVGKDIIRFHGIFWPAFLMAAGLPLPKQIVVHAHWTMEGAKMSKSRGNVIDPVHILEKYGSDLVRYHLMCDGRLSSDSDYSEAKQVLYYEQLRSQIGNLLQRIASRQICRDHSRVVRTLAPVLSGFQSSQSAIYSLPGAQEFANRIETVGQDAPLRFQDFEIPQYLDDVMQLIAHGNRFVQAHEPWALAKKIRRQDGTADELASAARHIDEIVFLTLESLRVASILLLPIMPIKAGDLLDRLGVRRSHRLYKYAHLGADSEYGDISHSKEPPFPPIDFKQS